HQPATDRHGAVLRRHRDRLHRRRRGPVHPPAWRLRRTGAGGPDSVPAVAGTLAAAKAAGRAARPGALTTAPPVAIRRTRHCEAGGAPLHWRPLIRLPVDPCRHDTPAALHPTPVTARPADPRTERLPDGAGRTHRRLPEPGTDPDGNP